MDAREQIDHAFRVVFGTEDSHRSPEQMIVLAVLRNRGKPREVHYTPTETDRDLAFRQGRLETWLEIERRITRTPETLAQLLGLATGDSDND
jgi:hypothetical protein